MPMPASMEPNAYAFNPLIWTPARWRLMARQEKEERVMRALRPSAFIIDTIAIQNMVLEPKKIRVFYCGVPELTKELRELAQDFSRKTSTKFEFHKENF
ncbi:hypothetical protein EJB05_26913, partial [Eragrostis curvula]